MSKKVLFILIGIIIIGIVLFSVRSKSNIPAGEDGVASYSTSALGSDFVKALLGVNTISLETSLFNSPVFNSLNASGAYVDPSPDKGRIDPFSSIGKVSLSSSGGASNSIRDLNLGNSNLNSNVNFVISKITTTTASITITGLPESLNPEIVIMGSNDSLNNIKNFTYKKDSKEYTTTVTGLISKIKYTVKIISPENYSDLQAEFTTR